MVVLPLPPLKLTTVMTWRCSDARAPGQILALALAVGVEIGPKRLNILDRVGAAPAGSGVDRRAFTFKRKTPKIPVVDSDELGRLGRGELAQRLLGRRREQLKAMRLQPGGQFPRMRAHQFVDGVFSRGRGCVHLHGESFETRNKEKIWLSSVSMSSDSRRQARYFGLTEG